MTRTFSHVTDQVKEFLKDAVEVPPEEPKPKVIEEELEQEPEEELVEDISELPTVDDSQEILAQLNTATSHWKETGDVQVHFDVPSFERKERSRFSPHSRYCKITVFKIKALKVFCKNVGKKGSRSTCSRRVTLRY